MRVCCPFSGDRSIRGDAVDLVVMTAKRGAGLNPETATRGPPH